MGWIQITRWTRNRYMGGTHYCHVSNRGFSWSCDTIDRRPFYSCYWSGLSKIAVTEALYKTLSPGDQAIVQTRGNGVMLPGSVIYTGTSYGQRRYRIDESLIIAPKNVKAYFEMAEIIPEPGDEEPIVEEYDSTAVSIAAGLIIAVIWLYLNRRR